MSRNKSPFPSLGEVVREVFNCLGILPQKRDSGFTIESDTQKKRIQMKLKRLADESSKLDGQIDELLKLLYELTYEATGTRKFARAIYNSVIDVLEQYKDLIRSEGTFLPNSESIRWLIECRLSERIAISTHKWMIGLNLIGEELDMPSEDNWWVPTVINEKKIVWPIEKVWKWIYKSKDCSQSTFHLPFTAQNNPFAKQELENAQRWTSGRQLPSYHAMRKSLDSALDRIEISNGASIKKTERRNLYIALFIARISTYFSRNFYKEYGVNRLEKLSVHVYKQYKTLLFETEPMVNNYQRMILEKGRSNCMYADRIFSEVSRCFWENKSMEITYGAHRLENYRNSIDFDRLHPISRLKIYLKLMGKWGARGLLQQERFVLPETEALDFGKLLIDGMNLRKSESVSIEQIEKYHKEVLRREFGSYLEWLVDWNYATFFYRQQKDKEAYPYYEKAFHAAKYIAGGNQYKLVNQYIESCAKNKKFKEFRKGIAWANYLGIKVRWLRGLDDPESSESLQYVFSFMGNECVRYHAL